MPITSLTQSPRSFLRLGHIRKGEKDERGIPHDLSYFRVTFLNHPRKDEIERVFRSVYGDCPVSINVRFAYPEVSRVWDAAYECYKKGGLFAKASSTEERGLYWEFYRDLDTAEVHISGGLPRTARGGELLATPIDLSKPIYHNSKKEPQFMTPVGRLEVVIPEVAAVAVGYFEFRPESARDIRNISAELNMTYMIASQYEKSLLGIPFKLFRREETISKKIEDKLTSGPSWVVHIEADAEWGKRALELVDALALPDIVDGEVVGALPAPTIASIIADSALVPVIAPAPSPEKNGEMIAPLGMWAVDYAAVEWNISKRNAAQEIARKFPDKKQVLKSEFLSAVQAS